MATLDAFGRKLHDLRPRSVEEAIADIWQGVKPSARKAGRNPRWPHVPVIVRPMHHINRPDLSSTQQLPGKAFATRDEAIAYAQKAIDAYKQADRSRFHDMRMNAFRTQWGVANSDALGPSECVVADAMARIAS